MLIIPMSITTHAQLEKGAKLVGLQTNIMVGDIYYAYLSIDANSNESNYGLNLVPTMGWAIQRNWVIGGQATLGFLTGKDNESTNENISTYYDLGIAPFTRLYLDLTKNKKLKIFGMAAVEFASSYARHTTKGGAFSYTDKTRYSSVLGTLGGGLGYFGRKIAIDLNASNTGLRLGVYKTLSGRKK